MIREAVYYARMTAGIYRLLRHPLPADPDAALRAQMEHREAHFLDLARRVVFSQPGHPYREMFRLAGCAWEDLAAEVQRRGLEVALENLAAAGVYVTHDEFKGKTPAVRGGREIPCGPAAFLNPLVRGYLVSASSGSRSRGTMTPKSAEYQLYRDAYHRLQRREFALDGLAGVQVRPILPSSLGIGSNLRCVRWGQQPARWFAQSGHFRDAVHYRAVTHFLVRFARLMGAPAALPDYLPENDFSPVARWIAQSKQAGVACFMRSYVSPAVRVAAAAREARLDIAGTIFLVDGETLTDAKREGIEAAGCEVYPRYGITEVGSVGSACRQMRAGNSVHVHRDALAVIGRRRRAPLCDVEVNSLLFTNLLPFAPRFLINAEMDDAGILEPASCHCEYSRAGFHTQLRNIYSYGKLTGQGITLLGSDIVRILEAALPQRFGGVPGDYQLVEYDGERQAQVELRVSLRAGAARAGEIREFFLREVRRCYGGALAARVWAHSDGLEVVMAEPFATRSGKVLPLHLLGGQAESAHA